MQLILGPKSWNCCNVHKMAVNVLQKWSINICCYFGVSRNHDFFRLFSNTAFCLLSLYLIEVEQISLDANISHADGVCCPVFVCTNLRKSVFASTIQYVKPEEWCTCMLHLFRVRVWKLSAPLKIIIWIVKSENHDTHVSWKKVLYKFKRYQE